VSSEDEDGYVHDPEAFRDDATEGDDGTSEAAGTGGGRATGDATAPEADGLDTRGWVLVAAVVLSFFVIPGIVLVRPPGLPFEVALLILPLLPAVLLGAVAVWAMADRG